VADDGVAARRTALEALARIEDDGAYANLALPAVLERATLDERDRGFVTDLVYGSVRMRRACDFLVDRFLSSDPPPAARRVLRLGAYQLAFRDDLPDYAVVSATVAAAPKRFRGLANAVLRRVASAPVEFPDDATRLSYPDWIVERLVTDLGADDALGALEAMDRPPVVHRRADGYVQDLASQWVAELAGATPGDRVADLCAAPGGKATAMAQAGATVVAADLRPARVGLVASNAASLGTADVLPVVADARRPPLRPRSFDVVLLDAPCSGLGVLRRRPDARWRVDPDAPERLGALAVELVDAAVELVRPGGLLAFSVCTLTAAESLAVDDHLARARPELEPLDPPPSPWRPWGRGALLLPQAADTDGMCLFRYRTTG
jgi:16S rRNA (cytosine967-C5)-methyltransferase